MTAMKPGSVKGPHLVGADRDIVRSALGAIQMPDAQPDHPCGPGTVLVPDVELRDKWVEAHYEVIKRARSAPGCLDLYLLADPVEEGRVNMFEQWESEEHLEAWRAVADPPPKPEILGGNLQKHQISSSGPPF